MKRFLVVAAIALFAANASYAQTPGSDCEAKAIDKNGKPLTGAAKNSFTKKCENDAATKACEAKAIDKNGKALAGAAKNSSIKKCMKENAAAK